MKGDTINEAEVGDSVKYKTPQGQFYSGVVRMRFPEHVVIIVKGRGMPQVVDANNFVSMRRGKNRREMVRWL